MFIIDENIRQTAAKCRHYAMCKIDYLGTGLCPAGSKFKFVSYFPQGRMDIVNALARRELSVTDGLLKIADSCNLCGICDLQCHFYSGLRPLPVMSALKEFVTEHTKQGLGTYHPPKDQFVSQLKSIVGEDWASNDPAILITYSHDPFPLNGPKLPRAVVLPGSAEEVERIVALARDERTPLVTRGHGSSVYGKVFTTGVVLDTSRLNKIDFDLKNWSVTIGPGVTAFDLQREAASRGVRVSAAEASATVIGNIICTGLFSPWAVSYGMGQDHVLDMEFIDDQGSKLLLSNPSSLATYHNYKHCETEPQGVCTSASVRLHPISADEEGVLVPFADLASAIDFARELASRRIGLAVAILGPHYLASFISPSLELQKEARETITNQLGIKFVVSTVVDKFGKRAIQDSTNAIIDQSLFRTIVLGLPQLVNNDGLDIVTKLEGAKPPYEIFCSSEVRWLLETILEPSPETIASSVEPDMREAYARAYRNPNLTDIAWLNSSRIVSPRLARHKHVIPFIIFGEHDFSSIDAMSNQFAETAKRLELSHEFGFITPLDFGKRCVFEYDYFIDHTDPVEQERIASAMSTLAPWLDRKSTGSHSNMTWLKTVFCQGNSRKEGFLFRNFAGRPSEENSNPGGPD